ncbi:High-affinity branched-chain amino acid transport ATP-binding protein LivF [Paraburkholderia caffeinitolerans]|uniref:High-affinity branched-chain amino acid transport ATP-binding protein LivF n=1 Tax=Paraburkholderia caffeinitolerans TaxID=1723730 RepID=A0A6J5GEP6_9BURK|nr:MULTISPECIES: ABC transporter ATP-binding protein [Paraburkholderia]CAB3799391.1 High-affinity branched-chain amino acid transport ATP-binding protein LivF [Paraburkholderia caffeinitolerans]
MNALLEVGNLRAWYGASQVLHGVDLCIGAGEIVALAGRNGSGRSTFAKALMSMVEAEGVRRFAGMDLAPLRTFEIARLGLGYVAEQRDVFPTLTVDENLSLGLAKRGASRFTIDDARTLFPILLERRGARAGVLSGGEQQMLALARALVGGPNLLIVDEPAEGLSAQMAARVGACLRACAARGIAVLLIEQRLELAPGLADRVAVMGHGRIVFEGAPGALAQREDIVRDWLGVG